MKRAGLFVCSLLFALPVMAFDQDSLLNRPMPLINNKTLDDKTIDKQYYEGHLTLVSFMFVGCLPCMNEIGMLNKIKREYSANPEFQVLCIASQMRGQMEDFNADNDAMMSKARKAFKTDRIEYPILPACADGASKWKQSEDNIRLGSECNTTEEVYGVTAFPTIFFVDNKGIVRKVDRGGPATKDDTVFYNDLKKEIDELLAK